MKIINKKWQNTNLFNAFVLSSLSLIVSFLYPIIFYETTDDPLYRMISTGDFNSYIGPDSHVNFTSYLYLEFLIFLKKLIGFNYFWDLCNYLITFLAIFLLSYNLLKLNNKYIKYFIIILSILHFPSYFVSFHLTKVSGLLVCTSFLLAINLCKSGIKLNKSLYLNMGVILLVIFLASITRLKASLLYVPTLIFCLIPILFSYNFSNLKKSSKLIFIFIFIGTMSLFSILLWNANVSYYSRSEIWKDFYSYNDNRYQLMEYNNFRDTKKYVNIFSKTIQPTKNIKKDKKIERILNAYKESQLIYYGQDKLIEICKKLDASKNDCFFHKDDGNEAIISKILTLKEKTLNNSKKNLEKEFLKYNYLEKIDKKMNEVGFTFNDYIVMEHWYFFDNNVYSKKQLNDIVNHLNINNFSKQFGERLKFSFRNLDNSLKKQFPLGSTNLYLILSIFCLGIIGFFITSNLKNLSYSLYLGISLLLYCAFIENFIKPLPNWIYFPMITILISSQIIYFSLNQSDSVSIRKKWIAYSFSILFILLTSQVLIQDYKRSTSHLYNNKVLNSFFLNKNNELKNKIIVNVGAHIPAGDWCFPFKNCTLRKEFKFTGLGWTTQMGHDLIFYKENNIDNLALKLVNNDSFIVAIDLYPLIKNRLAKYYKDHYSCSIYFQDFAILPRSDNWNYKIYSIKSRDACTAN